MIKHKLITIILVLILSTVSKAQEKKSNCITIEVSNITMSDIEIHLAKRGIFPQTITSNTYSSCDIPVKGMIINVSLLIHDNQISIFGTYTHKTLGKDIIEYRGQKGSPALVSFQAMNSIIKSFPYKNTTYSIVNPLE